MDKKINKIAHLADIHIRKLHRFVEYRDVFDRLYKKLRESKPDLIYIGGDIVHGKLDTSPEETRLVAEFFLNLADISDLLVIPGNHDCNLNNASREDVLSPIIDLVQQINPRIHFWKKTGVYEMGGCQFGHLSVFDITKDGKPNAKNIPRAKDIDGKHKIAIYHGGVGNFQVDTGLVMSDEHVNVIDFDGYDLVLLGDIHKRQFLNDDETVAYPGSLIQQNFSEAPDHGFLLWDVKKRKSEFVQVENDYGFKTIRVEDDEVKSKMNFVPRYGNLKIKHKGTSAEKLRLVEMDLRKTYSELKSISFEKLDSIENIMNNSNTKISIEDIHDLKVQNNLIDKMARLENPAIDDKTIQRLFDINEFTNSSVGMKNELPKNVDWKLKYIEFDNMFSYGKKNKVDFTKLNGVVGVVAPNHSGKSALIDAIAYTIFDTCSRTFKAIEVLNNKSKNFEVKLSLEVNGVDYIIHRTGKLKVRTSRKTGEVRKLCPVSVKFYVIENDEMIDLSGAARSNSQYGSGTNEEIRKILGTFDDFILTSLSLQNNGQNFVDKKQSERKKILSQFMGIDLFEKLHDIARDDVAEEKAYLKRIKDKNIFQRMGKLEQTLVDLGEKKDELEQKIEPIETDIKKFKDQIVELKSKLKDVDDIKELDFRELISEKESELETQKEALKLEDEYKDNIRPLYNTIYSKLKEYDEETLEHNYNKFKECKEDLSKIKSDATVKENQIKHLETSLSEVKEHEFDENCEYCLKNGQWHIEKTKSLTSEIKDCKLELDKILTNKSHREKDIESFGDIEQDKSKYEYLMEDLKRVEGDAYKTHAKVKELELSVEQTQSTLKKITEEQAIFLDNEVAIAHNYNLTQKIDKLETQVRIASEALSENKKDLTLTESTILIEQTNQKNLGEEIKDLVKAEQKVSDYEIYLRLVNRDGIPQLIINDALPIIENEVNTVLDHMMAGFQLGITSEDKSINLYIKYDDQVWPLSLSSGMEKFVSSLALRVGLINVSNLPSPNFLVIDEGFGTLDTDNLSNMKGAFDYLKTRFDSVFIISHLDTIKDFMDYLLPVNVGEDGFSKVVYN
jgi:DNA repair exonuclease SbcCD ATPase subunit